MVVTMARHATFEISSGYCIILPKVQNVYPMEFDESAQSWCYGFKYESGMWEFFYFKEKSDGERERTSLIRAIDEFWCGK